MAIASIRKLSLFLLLCSLVLPAAIPFSQQALPDYAFVEGFVGHGQTYPLSCESRSAADLANYWGVQVGEVQFFNALPKSDNPDKGFVGSVFGSVQRLFRLINIELNDIHNTCTAFAGPAAGEGELHSGAKISIHFRLLI